MFKTSTMAKRKTVFGPTFIYGRCNRADMEGVNYSRNEISSTNTVLGWICVTSGWVVGLFGSVK